MIYLRAIDQYSDHSNYFQLFLSLPNVFNKIKFFCVLFLVTVVQFSTFFRSDLGR